MKWMVALLGFMGACETPECESYMGYVRGTEYVVPHYDRSYAGVVFGEDYLPWAKLYNQMLVSTGRSWFYMDVDIVWIPLELDTYGECRLRKCLRSKEED